MPFLAYFLFVGTILMGTMAFSEMAISPPLTFNATSHTHKFTRDLMPDFSGQLRTPAMSSRHTGAVAELVGNEGGVVSGVFNLESSDVEASDWRPRHDEHYHEA